MNQAEFNSIKSILVHNTEYTDVTAEITTINQAVYVGLKRTSYYFEDKGREEPQTKSILIPLLAWRVLLNQVVPRLEETLKPLERQQQQKQKERRQQVQQRRKNQQEGRAQASSTSAGFKRKQTQPPGMNSHSSQYPYH